MGKAKVKAGWQVYWPPASKSQKVYGPGEIVEFDGEAPQIEALEILQESKNIEAPPHDKMIKPGKAGRGSQNVIKK